MTKEPTFSIAQSPTLEAAPHLASNAAGPGASSTSNPVGLSGNPPSTKMLGAATVCRPAAKPCDVAEVCMGAVTCPVEVPPACDAGVSDAGVSDAGVSDAGGDGDGGATDAGETDAGQGDAGSADAGALDAGTGAERGYAVGCGCGAGADPSLAALAFLLLGLSRRTATSARRRSAQTARRR